MWVCWVGKEIYRVNGCGSVCVVKKGNDRKEEGDEGMGEDEKRKEMHGCVGKEGKVR